MQRYSVKAKWLIVEALEGSVLEAMSREPSIDLVLVRHRSLES